MTMPLQKPGRSKQDYGTPPEFLDAVRRRLRIENFSLDVASSDENAVCDFNLTEKEDALSSIRSWVNPNDPTGWAWCNPPYSNIESWVMKAAIEAHRDAAHVAVLVPASVGANWWLQWVVPYSYQVFLNGRLKFVGCKDYYPKDCALLLYTPFKFKGTEVWDWE